MAISTGDITKIFKVLGKCIFLSQIATTQADELRKIAMVMLDQSSTGVAAEFDWFNAVMLPANTRIKTTIGQVNGLSTTAVTTINNYLLQGAAPSLGLDPATTVTPAQVLDALRAAIQFNRMYLTPGGVFMVFIVTQLGYPSMPTVGTTLIPDSYISDILS